MTAIVPKCIRGKSEIYRLTRFIELYANSHIIGFHIGKHTLKIMKKTLFTIVLMMCCSGVFAKGSYTLKEYLDFKEKINKGTALKEEIDVTNIYMNGLANGFNYYNGVSRYRKQSELFCLPSKMLMNYNTLDNAIQSYIESDGNHEIYNKLKDSPIEMAALVSLMNIYPCN